MALNSMKMILVLGVLAVGSVQASTAEANNEYLTIKSKEITRINVDPLNQEVRERLSFSDLEQMSVDTPTSSKGVVSVANVGKVIAVAKDLVALGESIYTLVQKGKPSNKTTSAPISVIPKEGGSYIDIFDTENWSAPRKNTYEIIYKNYFGMEVVKYRYSVIFSYGGSYKGKGAYLTAAQIVPVSINTLYGYTFSATMKLNGITNHGTKENPIAGAIMAMEYTVETVLQASLTTDSYHITGRGGFKQL